MNYSDEAMNGTIKSIKVRIIAIHELHYAIYLG